MFHFKTGSKCFKNCARLKTTFYDLSISPYILTLSKKTNLEAKALTEGRAKAWAFSRRLHTAQVQVRAQGRAFLMLVDNKQ
jgi:hypothetical protein